MINGFWNKVSSYIDLAKVHDISTYLDSIKNGVLIESKTPFDCIEFFKLLEEDAKDREYKRNKTTNIQARCIEILLPASIDLTNVSEFSSMFMNDVLGKEELPYASWFIKKGKGSYLFILISERIYSFDAIEFKEIWKSDGYRNKKNGQLCKESDPEALCFRLKGDVKKTYTSHFSLKSRLFTADVDAKKNNDDSERIGFRRFIDRIRQKLVYCFIFMKVKVNKSLFLPKKKHFKTMNKYQIINVNRVNEVIKYIEQKLQDLWQIMISDAKYIHYKKNMDRFNSVYYKYKKIFENGKFTYKAGSDNKFKMKFNVYNNVSRFQETMESLKLQFEDDMDDVRLKVLGTMKEKIIWEK